MNCKFEYVNSELKLHLQNIIIFLQGKFSSLGWQTTLSFYIPEMENILNGFR